MKVKLSNSHFQLLQIKPTKHTMYASKSGCSSLVTNFALIKVVSCSNHLLNWEETLIIKKTDGQMDVRLNVFHGVEQTCNVDWINIICQLEIWPIDLFKFLGVDETWNDTMSTYFHGEQSCLHQLMSIINWSLSHAEVSIDVLISNQCF